MVKCLPKGLAKFAECLTALGKDPLRLPGHQGEVGDAQSPHDRPLGGQSPAPLDAIGVGQVSYLYRETGDSDAICGSRRFFAIRILAGASRSDALEETTQIGGAVESRGNEPSLADLRKTASRSLASPLFEDCPARGRPDGFLSTPV